MLPSSSSIEWKISYTVFLELQKRSESTFVNSGTDLSRVDAFTSAGPKSCAKVFQFNLSPPLQIAQLLLIRSRNEQLTPWVENPNSLRSDLSQSRSKQIPQLWRILLISVGVFLSLTLAFVDLSVSVIIALFLCTSLAIVSIFILLIAGTFDTSDLLDMPLYADIGRLLFQLAVLDTIDRYDPTQLSSLLCYLRFASDRTPCICHLLG